MPDNGSADKPFQSAEYALFVGEQADPPTIFVRAKGNADYVEITKSALKKAKKNADGLFKKAKKVEELKQREEQEKGAEAERLQRKLEESKKIVLEEDTSLPKSTKVTTFPQCIIFFHYTCSGQNRELAPLAWATRSHLWVGSPTARPKRHHFY